MKAFEIGTLVKMTKEDGTQRQDHKDRGLGIIVGSGKRGTMNNSVFIYHVFWPQKGRKISAFPGNIREVTSESR